MANKTYTVLKIDELTRPADGGGLRHVYRHQIKTTGGIVLTVEIGPDDFTPEKAGPILEAAAVNADKIKAL